MKKNEEEERDLMDSLLGRFFEGLQDELAIAILQSYCEDWREHPTKYAIAHAIGHAIERDHQRLVYETLVDPDFRMLRADGSGVNSLRADIQRAMDYFSATKRNLLRYYQILFLGQQIALFPAYDDNSDYQDYCQAYLQFLQLNEAPTQRRNVGISRVLNRLFPMEFKQWDQYRRYGELTFEPGSEPEKKIKLELISYEIGNWRCECGATQGHRKRYDLECKQCKISTGNGVIDGEGEICLRCDEPITYATCSECNTRVTLDIVWRIENGDIHPREMDVPLNVSLRKYVDGSARDTFSLTLLELPVMLGISEKNGTLRFDSPGIFWMDIPGTEYPFFILSEEKKYDRQTEPLKIFEALLSRTFRPYKSPKRSLKSRLQRGRPISQDSFSRGFSQRIARIAQELSPNLTDFAFDCLVSATDSLTHNMAIMNRNSILSKNLVALFVDQKNFSLREDALSQDDKITPTPLGKVVSTNLDEDGIVKVGARVYPGDVLVGVERPHALEELTAEEKLLRAIFGEKAQTIEDGSFVYDGTCPARVTSVEVLTSRKTKNSAFHPYEGKTVRQTELSIYGQNVYLRISISLSPEQPIEIGDTLYVNDESYVVICRMASGVELKHLAGCAEEPDLLVSADHPRAIPLLQIPSRCSLVQTFVRPDALIGQNINGRASGYYSLISQQPLWQANDYDNYNVAQVMTREDFSWLLHRNLMDTIFELLQMHSDCLDTREKLHELVESGSATVDANPGESFSPLADLVEAPGETVRYLAFLLRCLGIRVGLSEVNDFSAIRISLASPEQIRGWSYGEVTKPETINYRTLKPEKDGLFCERIFGPTKDWECYCGKYKGIRFKGIVCDKCGIEVARSKVRRERMGHIELAAPVSHIWYFKGKPSRIGMLLDLSPRNLERILYFAVYVVTHIDEMARQGELMRIDVELSRLNMSLDEQIDLLKSRRDSEVSDIRKRLDEAAMEIRARCDREIAQAEEAERETRGLLRKFMGQESEEGINFVVSDCLIVKAGEVVKQRDLETLKRVAETFRNDIAENARRVFETLYKQNRGEERNIYDSYQGQIDNVQTQLESQRVERRQRLEQQKYGLEGLKKMDMLLENRYLELRDSFGSDVFRAGMGAEAVRELLADINLERLSAELRKEIGSMDGQRFKKKATKRLNVVEAFLKSGTLPEWMILTVLPVLPSELRPMVKLDDGRFATSDLNDLYRRVINRNNRLKRLLELGAPEIIIRNEKRMLQEHCDALFENGRRGLPISNDDGTPLRSLSECITQLKPDCDTILDMLLKRPLDYTAQTRFTVEDTGNIDVAVLPESLVYELFNLFIMKSSNTSNNKSIINSDEVVLDKAPSSEDTSPFDCSKFAILVSTDSPFSRFIALRFRLTHVTHDLSLKVHDSLMDLLGWDLLGSSARIFALFSNEAIEEALRTLAPSKLWQQKPPQTVSDLGLDIAGKDIVSFVSMKALSQESVAIGPYGWFLTTPFRYPK